MCIDFSIHRQNKEACLRPFFLFLFFCYVNIHILLMYLSTSLSTSSSSIVSHTSLGPFESYYFNSLYFFLLVHCEYKPSLWIKLGLHTIRSCKLNWKTRNKKVCVQCLHIWSTRASPTYMVGQVVVGHSM